MTATDELRRIYWDRITRLFNKRFEAELRRRTRKGYRLRQTKR